jgi:hypothetical protein
MKAIRDIRLTVLLTPDERAALAFAARRRGISASDALRLYSLPDLVAEYERENHHQPEEQTE